MSSKQSQLSLSAAEVKNIISSIKANKGVRPQDIDPFLSLEGTPAMDQLDKVIPVVLLTLHIILLTLKNYFGDTVPTGIILPRYLHAFLQAIHDIFSKEADSPALRDHLIPFLLEASIVWGLLKTVPNWINLKSHGARILEVQTIMRDSLTAGKFHYRMARRHTAAFVGSGDKLATRLQEIKPIDAVMQYATTPIDKKVWQFIKPDSTHTETYAAFDRGGIKNAGEIIILPVKENDMFLPGKHGHDMTLDEIEGIISMVDEYCLTRKIQLKRIIVVGSRYMPQLYHQRKNTRKYLTSTVTLNDLVTRLSSLRNGATTEIIDPTEVVMEKVIDLAKGNEIEFHATAEGDQRYGERFCEILEQDLRYKAKKKKSIRVLYDIIDTPTQIHTTPQGDIAVILDSWRKEGMIKKGIREENIIIVPDLVLEYLSREVDES